MTTTSQRRGFWPLRDLPAPLWLVAAAGVAMVHPWVPVPRWLLVHLLLLGAVTHAILVWSQHFADALLHTVPQPADRRAQSTRLLLHNFGALLVVLGLPSDVWLLVAAGAAAVTAAVGWHGGALLVRLRRALPARFGATVRYYVAAAALLPVGALLGVLLARGLGDPTHARVLLAHEVVNVLGWMGLTVAGTLVTLWPTMLRTRIADGAERAARQALPVLVAAVLVTAGGALAGLRPVAAAGVLGYLAGLAALARPFVVATRQKPPSAFPTWSVLAGLLWLVGSLAMLAVGLATAPSWHVAHERVAWLTPALAAGFAAQVLLGALSYLVPVALGGGPSPVRAANAVLDRGGPLRVVIVNAGLLLSLLPVPSSVRVLASLLVFAGLVTFIPLLLLAIRASRRAKPAGTPPVPTAGARGGPAPVGAVRPRGQRAGLAAVGLVLVVLAVAGGVALDPSAITQGSRSAAAGVAPTGDTTRVVVRAADMRFTPSTIRVPAGDRLVVEVRNTDRTDVHDLALDSGAASGRLAPGESARLDVGVVGRDLDGWCSVLGHRQMGMVLRVEAVRPPPQALDFLAPPGPGFLPRDAALPPLDDRRVRRVTLTVRDVEREVAPPRSSPRS